MIKSGKLSVTTRFQGRKLEMVYVRLFINVSIALAINLNKKATKYQSLK
ncbi:hypothetical protein MADE_000001022590 [Alteromonas mediterranea DE]|uniref:Uncharacterized protein n=1 Tax=Alteromonas mediterranea (strain DSM 17117 / CIP 110805 / LMG 28347 / Deep ecotype) TaxID=1774373 RepID=T2DL48_ALTMD|nr:hypothetical protein MADE_000001022590 [Alteromonas mediterranea DE]